MSGVIGTSGTAVVIPNTAGSYAVTISSGVSISGTGTLGAGLYSRYVNNSTTVGSSAAVVGVVAASVAFSETIVNNGSIGGTTAGIRLVAPGTHIWSPTAGSPPAVYSTITASATINNNGTISGGNQGILIPTPPNAAAGASGASALFNAAGALIEGGENGVYIAAGGKGNYAVASGVDARIINDGTILGLQSSGAAVAFTGTLINAATGLIANPNGGFAIFSGNSPLPSYIYNAGHVTGRVHLLAGGTVINKANATISHGIYSETFIGTVSSNPIPLSVNNAGLIEANAAVGDGEEAVHGEDVNLFNATSGTILAMNLGNAVDVYASNTITNYGVISGTGFHSGIGIKNVSTVVGSTVLNESGATINGDSYYAISVTGNEDATVTNHGLISGTFRLYSGRTTESTIVNTGVILADSDAGNYNPILNGRAIALSGYGTATITNAAGGTISSGTVNGGSEYAIGLGAGVTALVTNQGLIAGEVIFNNAVPPPSTLVFASTLVNAGIIGTSAAGDAVSFAAGSQNRLVVDPSASFVGTIDGGNTIGATAASNLEFGAGNGTFSGFGSTVLNFAQITIDSGSNWLLSGSAGGWNGETVTGFGSSNTIELVGTVEHKSSFTGNTLSLDGGTTLNIAGSYTSNDISVTNDGTNTLIKNISACFAEGTRVATARGEVAVESLHVGDRVVTASGRLAPVRWLGHRRTDIARHPRPDSVMPVRIRTGAFGPGLPVRDLVVSPDHALFADGHLFHARYLVNGVSIVTEQRPAVTYWHVELDHHDVLLAEGLPCESYLDTGNRAAFENAPGPTQLHPEFEPSAHELWETEGCAPVHTDPGDAVLRGLRLRLLASAGIRRDLPVPCNADMAISRTA